MKRKLITLEIYANVENIDDSEMCIKDLLEEINCNDYVNDGTLDVEIRENHIEMYKQLNKNNLL
jgi:hypothetical protein